MVVSCDVSSSTKGSPTYTDIHCFSISGCLLVKTSPNCLCEHCCALKNGHLGSSALACSLRTIEWIYRRPWLLTPTTTPRPAACSSPGTSSTTTPPFNREKGTLPGLYAALLTWPCHLASSHFVLLLLLIIPFLCLFSFIFTYLFSFNFSLVVICYIVLGCVLLLF